MDTNAHFMMTFNKYIKYIFSRLKIRRVAFSKKAEWEFLREMVRAQWKVKDYNSFLGALWSLINPIFLTLILFMMFNRRLGSNIPNYSYYLLIGVVVVNYFLEITSSSVNYFVMSFESFRNHIIRREVGFLASFYSMSLKFIIILGLCMMVLLFAGLIKWHLIVWLPLITVFYLLFTFSISLMLAILNCFLRDVGHIWSMASRAFLFITPIFFSLKSLSPLAAKIVYLFNPVTPFVMSFRYVLMGQEGDPFIFIHCFIISTTAFIISYSLFLLLENAAIERI